MPHRDHGPGQGSSSKDEYGWLYGGPSDADTPAAPPQGRPGTSLPPPSLPPPSWATTRDGGSGSGGGTPPQPARRAARAPRGKGRRVRRIVIALVLVWVVFLVAVPFWAWGKITKVDADPAGDRPAEQPGQTFLLVGSDSRAGLTKAQQKELTTGSDGGGRGRTDTIMLMHTGSGPTLLLSIPRDSQVDIPGRGRGKINAAYAFGGPELLVQTIEQNTGVRVDDYVEIGFGGFVNIVDAVGGVQICPKKRLKDKAAGIDLRKGCQEADGTTALGYARSRKQYADSDISRVQSQREVLGAIASEVKSPATILNPFRYADVAGSSASSLSIGEDVGPLALGRFALGLSSAMGGGGLNCTVPIADLSVRWDRERALEMFGYVKQDRTADIGDLCTANGQVGG